MEMTNRGKVSELSSGRNLNDNVTNSLYNSRDHLPDIGIKASNRDSKHDDIDV